MSDLLCLWECPYLARSLWSVVCHKRERLEMPDFEATAAAAALLAAAVSLTAPLPAVAWTAVHLTCTMAMLRWRLFRRHAERVCYDRRRHRPRFAHPIKVTLYLCDVMICIRSQFPDPPLPLLITGVSGVSGYNAFHYFRGLYGEQVVGIRQANNWRLNHDGMVACDAEDATTLGRLFDQYRFAAVLDCAGNCALKSCELDPRMAWRHQRGGGAEPLASD